MAPGQEIAIRALGTALAGMSMAFAIYMLAYGGGKTRVNGIEHLAIFAQPRGAGGGPHEAALPDMAVASVASEVDPMTTGSLSANRGKPAPMPASRPPQIIAARADRVWLKVNGVLRSAVPGDVVPGVGHIADIVARDGGWVLLDDKGATLLSVSKEANGAAPLFDRDRIFN